MNEAYNSNTYKYMVPSICYTFDYVLNLINESCTHREIHERFLKHLLECILLEDQVSIEHHEIKFGDQEYKIEFTNKPKSIFALLNRYFASTYSFFYRKYEELSLKSLIDKLQLQKTYKIEEESGFYEKSLLFLTEPCMNSINEYFNELSVSEDKEKYVY